MLGFLTTLKSKLLLVMGGVIGVLLLFIRMMFSRNVRLKRQQEKQRHDQFEELYKRKIDAVNKMKEGLRNESKPATRGHFDKPDDQ